MQLAGRDTDFPPKAEFSAIGELGRGIDQHDAAIDAVEENFRRGMIFGNDAIGVVRPVAVDMPDGIIHPVHHGDGNDPVEIFRGPVRLGCGYDIGIELANLSITPDFAAALPQGVQDGNKMRPPPPHGRSATFPWLRTR